MQISSYSAASAMQQLQQSMLQKADKDADGSLTLDEFSAVGSEKNSGRTSSADQARAEKLFKSIDADSDGKASESELGSFFSKLSSENQSSLIALQAKQSSGNPMSDLLSKSDADGNGSLSLDEFSAAGPKGASSDKSAEIFGEIDSDEDGEVTEDELAAFAETRRPDGPPPPPPSSSGGAASGTSSLADMLAELSSDEDETSSTSTLAEILGQASDKEETSGDSNADFAKQISAYITRMMSGAADQARNSTSSVSFSA